MIEESADTAVSVGEGEAAAESRGEGVTGVAEGSLGGEDVDVGGDEEGGTMEVEGSSFGRKTELMSPMPTKKSSENGGRSCVSIWGYEMSSE